MQVEVFHDVEVADAGAMAVARRNGFGGNVATDPRNAHQKAQLGGLVFFDGSCAPSHIRDLARAACAITEVDQEGNMRRSLEVAVPWELPQTAQCAEHLAMAMGFEYVARESEFVGDCLNVTKVMDGSSRKALAATSKYAGLVLATHKRPEQRRLVHTVRWTKAHRTHAAGDSREVARDITANAHADVLAKSALKMHPALGAEVEAHIDFVSKRAHHVVAAVVAALELFPPAPRDMPRLPKPASAEEARARRQHHWSFSAGTWRCSVCRDWLNAKTLPAYRRHQPCRGKAVDDEAAALTAKGHVLCRAAADLPFVACTQCGAWGNRRTRKLAAPCLAPTTAGRQAIRRLQLGWHPMLRKSAAGHDLPRERAHITHVFDQLEAAWKPLYPAAAATTDHGASVHQAEGGRPPGREEQLMDDSPEVPPATAPPDIGSQEDVFGHGGGFDMDASEAPRLRDGSPATHRGVGGAAETVEMDIVSDGAEGEATAATSKRAGACIHGNAATRRRTTTPGSAATTRDLVWEAVCRAAEGLRAGPRDGQARLQRLRERVKARARPAADRFAEEEFDWGDNGGAVPGQGAAASSRDLGIGDVGLHALPRPARRRLPHRADPPRADEGPTNGAAQRPREHDDHAQVLHHDVPLVHSRGGDSRAAGGNGRLIDPLVINNSLTEAHPPEGRPIRLGDLDGIGAASAAAWAPPRGEHRGRSGHLPLLRGPRVHARLLADGADGGTSWPCSSPRQGTANLADRPSLSPPRRRPGAATRAQKDTIERRDDASGDRTTALRAPASREELIRRLNAPSAPPACGGRITSASDFGIGDGERQDPHYSGAANLVGALMYSATAAAQSAVSGIRRGEPPEGCTSRASSRRCTMGHTFEGEGIGITAGLNGDEAEFDASGGHGVHARGGRDIVTGSGRPDGDTRGSTTCGTGTSSGDGDLTAAAYLDDRSALRPNAGEADAAACGSPHPVLLFVPAGVGESRGTVPSTNALWRPTKRRRLHGKQRPPSPPATVGTAARASSPTTGPRPALPGG